MAVEIINSAFVQTGIDDSLDIFSGLDGASLTTLSSGRQIVDLSRKLTVNGTLSFDPKEQALIFASLSAYELVVNGTLNIVNDDVFSPVDALHFLRQNSANQAWRQQSANLYVANNGTLRLENCNCIVGSPIFLVSANSNLITRGAAFECRRNDAARIYIRSWSSAGFDSEATTYRNLVISFFAAPQKIDNPKFIDTNASVEGAANTGTDNYLVVENFQSLRNSNVTASFRGRYNLLNAENGSADVGGNGRAKVESDYVLKVVDADGVGVENAHFFQTDHDSGNRGVLVAGQGASEDFTDDRTFLKRTDAQGEITETRALLATVWGAQAINDSSQLTVDRRSADEDVVNGHVFAFGKNYENVSMNLKGLGVKRFLVTLFDDPMTAGVTEADVAAYSSIASAKQLYCAVKKFKVDNPTTGSLNNPLLISRDGDALVVLSGWTLAADVDIEEPLLIDEPNQTITVKPAAGGIAASDGIGVLSGAVDDSLVGQTQLAFVKINGLVNVTANINIDSTMRNPVAGVWLKSQGLTDRVGIQVRTVKADGSIVFEDLTPNTDYYITADAKGAYRAVGEFNTGAYGSSPSAIELAPIVKPDGSAILLQNYTAEQEVIRSTLRYNASINRVELVLPENPADYGDRWDDEHAIWSYLANDFPVFAGRVEEIQSAAGFLSSSYTIRVEDGALVIHPDSGFRMIQSAANPDGVTFNMAAFTIRREADDRQQNTFLDHANGLVQVNAGAPIVATVQTPKSILDEIVNEIPGKVDDAARVQAIEADTNELQTNQSNWMTASGYALPSDVRSAADAALADAPVAVKDSYKAERVTLPADLARRGDIEALNNVSSALEVYQQQSEFPALHHI